MSKATVKAILNEIDSLSEPDRRALERELDRRLEDQWQAEARKARRLAKQRHIDQAAIDRAITQRRYGR
jgi:hypothetical protein